MMSQGRSCCNRRRPGTSSCLPFYRMPPRRYVPSPSLDCLQRSSLESKHHPAVDAVLKQLRASSRRLQAALDSHRTELQVLERLYYKGKNQHRTALFWQRVAELRKLCERVDEMHMDEVVENLRMSFWGEPSARTKKVLKGPWTHYPDARFLLSVLERCSACCTLIDRVQERSLRAYESFMLMMQTGAFLQLILALAAIASRTKMLLSEMKAALEISWSASYTALQTLHPSDAQKVKRLLQPPEGHIVSSSTVLCATASRPGSKMPTPSETLEDLGCTLARTTPTLGSDDILAQAAPVLSVALTVAPVADETERFDITHFSLSSELGQDRHVPSASGVASAPTAKSVLSATKRKKDNEDVSSKAAKKRKKKRDEIDDIFGF